MENSSGAAQEVTALLQDMAEDVLTFSTELELQSAQIKQLSVPSTTNRGKQIDKVSPLQARHKVAQVATLSQFMVCTFLWTPARVCAI